MEAGVCGEMTSCRCDFEVKERRRGDVTNIEDIKGRKIKRKNET